MTIFTLPTVDVESPANTSSRPSKTRHQIVILSISSYKKMWPTKSTDTLSIRKLEELGLCRPHKSRIEASTTPWVLYRKATCLSLPNRSEWCPNNQAHIANLATNNKKLPNISCICRGWWIPSSRGPNEKTWYTFDKRFSAVQARMKEID